MTLQTIEQKIVAEYGVVIGFIKNYAVWCTLGALWVGFCVGRI